MNKALLNSLTTAERRFATETSPEALAGLDEDAALDLHHRARRMRDRYVQNYRRAASAAVRARGGRGASFEESQRDRSKAELFETSLSRVSRRLGVLARQSATELRKERIAAARAGRIPPTRPMTAASRSMGAAGQAEGDAR